MQSLELISGNSNVARLYSELPCCGGWLCVSVILHAIIMPTGNFVFLEGPLKGWGGVFFGGEILFFRFVAFHTLNYIFV